MFKKYLKKYAWLSLPLAFILILFQNCSSFESTLESTDQNSSGQAGQDNNDGGGSGDNGNNNGGGDNGGNNGGGDGGNNGGGDNGGGDNGGTDLSPFNPFDQNITYSQTLYVSSNASPGNGNGSQNAPYANLSEALNNASAGTEIILLQGTYPAQGTFSNVGGTANAPVAIRGQGTVVIDAQRATIGLGFDDPHYLVLENFAIQNTSAHGMNISDGGDYSTPAHHLILRNIHFRNIGSGGNNDCLKMSGVDDFYILGSEFENCNQGETIDMVGCHNGVISGNDFHDTPRNGVQTKGGSADVLIHGNRFTNIAQRAINAGGSTGEPYFRPMNAPYEAARIRMIANVIENSGGGSVAFVGCDGCELYNNTIIEPSNWAFRILQESTDPRFAPSRNGRVINNIIVFNSSMRSVVNIGSGTDPGSFLFRRNLWFSLDNPGFSGPNLGSVPPETNSIIQMDPQFTNRVGRDYRIPANSPAKNSGENLYGNEIVPDRDLQNYANPPSLGAYQ